MGDARKPDAVLVPATLARNLYPSETQAYDRARWYKDQFSDILGSTLVYSRHCMLDGTVLLTSPAGLEFQRYFPSGHPKAGQEQFQWEDQGDGIKYGYHVESLTTDDASQ